jgi:hypothetical protein
MHYLKQTLFRLFAIFSVTILPLLGMGMAGYDSGAPDSVVRDNEAYTTTESQVNGSRVRVGVYRGRYYYYSPSYNNNPQRSYYRRYHAPRPRYPRYNYRYYYYKNQRPYGPAYYGN